MCTEDAFAGGDFMSEIRKRKQVEHMWPAGFPGAHLLRYVRSSNQSFSSEETTERWRNLEEVDSIRYRESNGAVGEGAFLKFRVLSSQKKWVPLM